MAASLPSNLPLLSPVNRDRQKLRAEMYAEMQQILHDDGGIQVLMFNNYVSAHTTKVAHGDLNSNYDMDGGHIFRNWWFA